MSMPLLTGKEPCRTEGAFLGTVHGVGVGMPTPTASFRKLIP